jgi:hypothetical protein
MIDDPARMLTAEDVARRLGVSRRRVRLIPAAELPFAQFEARGVRRYAPADLERYIERRTIRS